MSGKTNPNYKYYNKITGAIKNRIHFQKHKLKYLLENFDENMTELENVLLLNNGYHAIFDAGNLRYDFTLNGDM